MTNKTIGITFKIDPISPDRNINGPKTAAVVRNDDTRPTITSLVPLTAASFGGSVSRHLSIFSAITILSSMMMPMDIKSARTEMTLMVTPSAPMMKSPSKKENGSAIEIHKASRNEKNRHMMMKTSAKDCRAFFRTSVMRSEITSVELLMIVSSRPPPICVLSFAR